ncbi:alpha/beta hydrolase [Terriglobus tenax]|uniref:alpha/beta hydrolase n=1 Tax=Terriglobus tenax TaxID=1111115 RepID=UPI0021E0CFB3|nr:alpha/beta hydrolase [Terriglobus tenax]
MRLTLPIALGLLTSTLAAPAQAPQTDLQHPPVTTEFIALPETATPVVPIEHKNIPYLHASGTDLQLDVYEQPGGKPAPVIVYFHGGAWWKNARPQSAASFHSLLSMGFSLVMVEYRLTGVAPAPAAIQDARCALSWVKKNAATYHFDTSEVIAFGTSSGGHQALMAGMLPASNNIELPECAGQPRVAAILDFYGISDVAELLHDGFTLQKSASRWIGDGPNAAALAKQMSPLNYIRAGLPPTFIVHGDSDPVVPYTQSQRLLTALRQQQVPVTLFTVPGGQHGKFTQEQSLQIGDALRSFLKANHLLPSR